MSKFNKDHWETPQWLFNYLDSMHRFDIDLCATKQNAKLQNYLSDENGGNSLDEDWHKLGKAGFCNPPYSNIKPWIQKAISELEKDFMTVMLIPTPNGESHYKDIFDLGLPLQFINGRLAFYNPSLKKEIGGNTRGSCLVHFNNHSCRNIYFGTLERDKIKKKMEQK